MGSRFPTHPAKVRDKGDTATTPVLRQFALEFALLNFVCGISSYRNLTTEPMQRAEAEAREVVGQDSGA